VRSLGDDGGGARAGRRARQGPEAGQASAGYPGPRHCAARHGRARPRYGRLGHGQVGRGAGLPSGPSRTFQAPDSVVQALLGTTGFRITRYSADLGPVPSGVERDPDERPRAGGARGHHAHGDTINYTQQNARSYAAGSPKLFDQTGVMVGHGMLYDACNHAGLIGRGTTTVKGGSSTWYLRGHLAVDNEQNRVYAAAPILTSCDLPDPHSPLRRARVKWCRRPHGARPRCSTSRTCRCSAAVIFQDMRRGRRSGLIPPQFGLNDIVRNSPTYPPPHLEPGLYWAIDDYADAQVTMDWYAQAVPLLGRPVRYRWLNRFITGGIAYSKCTSSTGPPASGSPGAISSSSRSRAAHGQHRLRHQLVRDLAQCGGPCWPSRTSTAGQLPAALRLGLAVRGWQPDPVAEPVPGQHDPAGRGVHSEPDRDIAGRDLEPLVQPVQCAPHARPVPPAPAPTRSSPACRETLQCGFTNNRQTSARRGHPLRVGRWNWNNALSVTDQ